MKTPETLFTEILESSLFRLDGPEIDLCDKLQELCKSIRQEDETDWYIGEGLACDLASLLIGAYWSLTEWHAGQESEEYATLCAIGEIFKPGMAVGPEPESSELIAYEAVNQYFEELTQKRRTI